MRTLIAAAVLSLAATPALAADPVEGDWLVQGGGAKVRIARCAGKPDRMCGVFTWLKSEKPGQPLLDAKNPNPQLRSQRLVGSTFIRDFRRVSEGRWTGGKIYSPEEGKTYDSKIRINPDGTLKLEGCVLVVCQAQTWRRPS
jgi:uncharacterized protein (DUF2147 family)